ncbi:hypothetical protein [Oceaniferula spumae]|uniref:hypothetical protein n=1 Tax=Oceaniferula spumae TaxID=2979115 RepID=UPI003F4E9687
MNLNRLRDRLIDSMHSDESATSYFASRLSEPEMVLSLCAICAPYIEYSNDCRMQAAYFLSMAPGELLGEVIPLMCMTLTIRSEDGDDMNGNIACHLIKAIRKGLPHYTGTLYYDLEGIAEQYGCVKKLV